MKRPIKKMISVFLAALMLLSVLPVFSAFAEETDGQRYVEAIALAYSNKQDRAKELITECCEVLVDRDINEGNNEFFINHTYIYMGYNLTDDLAEAITDIRLFQGTGTKKDEREYNGIGYYAANSGYNDIVPMLCTDGSFDLNKDIDTGDTTILYVTKDPGAGLPLTSISIEDAVVSGSRCACTFDAPYFPHNLNNGTEGNVIYMKCTSEDHGEHTPVSDAAVAPTCEKHGITEGSHCSVCNALLDVPESIPALGHVPVTDEAVEPAEFDTGLTKGTHCDRCGKILKKQETIPALGENPPFYTYEVRFGEKSSLTTNASDFAAAILRAYTVMPSLDMSSGAIHVSADCYSGDELVAEDVTIGKQFKTDKPVTHVVLESSHTMAIYWTLDLELILNCQQRSGFTYSLSDTETVNKDSHVALTDYYFDSLQFEPGETTHPDDHTPEYGEYTVFAPAGCTYRGLGGWTCSVCGYVEYETILPTAHNPEDTPYIAEVPATCTKDGSTAVYRCVTCGRTTYPAQVIPALGHDMQPVADKAPTCTEKGWTDCYKCSRCAYTEKTSIPETGHTYVTMDAVPATCTAAGNTAGEVCSVCGYIKTGYKALPVSHPDENDDDICDICGEQLISYEVYADVTNDCDGMEQTVSLWSGELLLDTLTFNWIRTGKKTMLSGKFASSQTPERINIKVDTKMSILRDVQYSLYCDIHSTNRDLRAVINNTEFGDFEAESGNPAMFYWKSPAAIFSSKKNKCDIDYFIDLTPMDYTHTPEVIPAVPATCTETGLTAGEKCSVCGKILTAQEEIPATGHTIETIPGSQPSCTSSGYTEKEICSICGKTITAAKTIPALGHLLETTIPAREPTCTLNGCTAQTKCSRCKRHLTLSVTIPMLGHIDEDSDGICDRCSEPYCEPAYTNTISVNDFIVDMEQCEGFVDPELSFLNKNKTSNYCAELTMECYNGDTLIYSGAVPDTAFSTFLPVTSVTARFGKGGLYFTSFMTSPYWKDFYEYGTVVCSQFTLRLLSQTTDGYTYSVLSETKPMRSDVSDTFTFGDNFVLPEEAHTDDHAPAYGELIECIPHTCTEDGLAYRECSVCAYKAYEIVEKAHAPEVIPGTAATCTETGLTEGVVCSVCGEVLTEPEIIPAAGHVDADDDAYCDVCGEQVREKNFIEKIMDFFSRIIDFFRNLFG